MLNSLIHGSVGFHSGVRVSAGLIAGLLTISLILMKPRYPQNTKKAASILNNYRVFLCDIPYVIMVFAWVIYWQCSVYIAHVDNRRRTTLIFAGSYYPIFFLQLNAIKNGIAPQLAFYTVQHRFILSDDYIFTQHSLSIDYNLEWIQCCRPCHSKLACA